MSDVSVEELQAQNAELAAKLEAVSKPTDGDESRKRLEFLEGEHKKLIEARDKAKEEKRQQEERLLAEQGEYKTLAEKREQEANELAASLEGLNAKLEAYQKRDEEELQTLLEAVPEALRDDVADESLPLEKRLALARKLSATGTKQPPASYRGSGEPEPESLQEQHAEAMKNGDISKAMALKRKMHNV